MKTPTLDATFARPRNLEILELIAQGRTVQEIATTLTIHPRSVRRRIDEMRRAWGCATNIALAAQAVRRGLI